MEETRYIIDKGVIPNISKDENQISFEEISNNFSTLTEYREYAIPNTNSWKDYIFDIFRVLGYVTEVLEGDYFSIAGNHTQNNKNIIVKISEQFKAETQLNISETVSTLSPLQEKKDYSWAIVTDGFEMNFFKLSDHGHNEFCYYANIEKIILDRRIDSFLSLFTVLQNLLEIYHQTRFCSKSLADIDIISENSDNSDNFPTLSLLALYKRKLENLRVNKNTAVWNASTNFSAPHKPALLLSILDIFDSNNNLSSVFELNNELKRNFANYWTSIFPNQTNGNIVLPFFHLQNDGFWFLYPRVGEEKTLRSIHEIDSISVLEKLTSGAKIHEELFYFLKNDEYRNTIKMCIIEKYFDQNLHSQLFNIANLDSQNIQKSQFIIGNLQQELNKHNGLFNGYIKLPYMAIHPNMELPTLELCKFYQYITMVQLCNLAQSFGRSRSSACNAFGGDNGLIFTLPERQARVRGIGKNKKLVLVSAAEEYFKEIGFIWE